MAERKDGLPRRGWTRPGREATKQPTIIDIAWAAGIWEGEGSISSARRTRPSITIMVTQKDHWVLDRLKELFGGYTYHLKSQVCGRWEITGPRARGFIYTIYSYLSPRRRLQINNCFPKELRG